MNSDFNQRMLKQPVAVCTCFFHLNAQLDGAINDGTMHAVKIE